MNLRATKSALRVAMSLLLASGATTWAVEVTFRVNMAVQIEALTFFPDLDTMELYGSFNGWASPITLEASQTETDVYEGTVDLTGDPGSTVQYKYVIHQGDDVVVWERDGLGPDGAQNRAVEVPDAPMALPVVYFNNETGLPGNVAVTFQVNLAIQKLLGNFDPASDTVEIRGSFNNWESGIPMTPSPTDQDVYQGTTDVYGSAGGSVEYKFVINQAGTLVWEQNVGPGGGEGNRSFTLGELSQTLPVEYFNNLSSDPGTGIPITFVVNLEVQAALGSFDPASDTVTVAGEFNTWSPTDSSLANSTADPYVYTGTYNVIAPSGSTVSYKFVVNGNTWEEGNNRTFLLPDSSQTLPTAFFNRQADLGSITVGSMSAAQITLEWTAAPGIRLQTATSLDSAWEDVPNTAGQGSATLPVDGGNGFFRLTGP